ncbi:ATP-dependent DNA helicase [Pleurocapsales cyanobacterium LEGE 06147]|nr:ATP-dependent DNA helicase [Pleurocapsales cyanobacterium LEGE 06147]
MIEVEVHSSLRAFLKEQDIANWPHHLTMARLVARTLRLGRSALIQTGSSVGTYCFSYLMPALMGDWSVILVAPQAVQQRLLDKEIPILQKWLDTNKKIKTGARWTDDFQGLLLTTPEAWLSDRLHRQGRFPNNIPTIIDRADDLEEWTRQQLTISLAKSDWDELLQTTPQQAESIRDVRVKLTKAIFAHPQNPYECYLLEKSEREILANLCQTLAKENLLSAKLHQFWQQWQHEETILWASIDREKGLFTLHLAPAEVASTLSPIWQKQPIVLIGSFLDRESSAPIYRQQLGLDELLCLKFSPQRQNEHIQLYLPDRLPLPNTPEFQGALLEQAYTLIALSSNVERLIVMLVEDVPLKAQVGTALAAEFGSRVRVEKTDSGDNGILISSWSFWHLHQDELPTPQLLIIATLPLPSLEHPLVASRVAYYKRQRQDWFRLYLLPTALRAIQEAVVPLRESQGIVALLDYRVNCRSYGKTILSALEPYARINYLDPSWFDLMMS